MKEHTKYYSLFKKITAELCEQHAGLFRILENQHCTFYYQFSDLKLEYQISYSGFEAQHYRNNCQRTATKNALETALFCTFKKQINNMYYRGWMES